MDVCCTTQRGAAGPVRSRPGRAYGLVPEDRKSEGLALIRSVQDNLLAAALPLSVSAPLVPARARLMRVAAELIDRLRVVDAVDAAAHASF